MDIRIKRIYEQPAKSDGERVLVDRVWPRGMRKADAGIDRWMKEVAPSSELRKWFGHGPQRWEVFRQRYYRELDAAPAAVEVLRGVAEKGRLTLLYGARDREHNNAVALCDYMLGRR